MTTGPLSGDEPLVCPVCRTPTIPHARYCHACGAMLAAPDQGVDSGAERRIVTVLFGDLSDFTAWAEDLDPERVGVVTDRVLAALSKAVTDVGGTVDKLTGDGIMAIFGAPAAHEDDPDRAVRAAVRMQAAIRRLMSAEAGGGRRMGLRVGLNTGEVLAGVQASLSYTVVGDTVNTASRLSDAAAVGAVYAGRETAIATMGTGSWRALPPLRLKGKREPVPAYELLGIRSPGAASLALGGEVSFVGRDAEFGRLMGVLLDVVEQERPAAAVITGEAGVGKTRLALELTRFAEELPDTRVLWGRCPPYGESRELTAMSEWMRTVFGVTDDEEPATAEARIRRGVVRLAALRPDRTYGATTVDRLLALVGLAELAPIGPRDTAAPGTVEPDGDPFIDTVAAVVDGLMADGPVVLVIDDAQWATESIVAAVGQLTERMSGAVLVLVVGRSDVLATSGWDALPGLETVPLGPLDAAASDRLLRAYLGGAQLDPDVSHLLRSRAQGNPFFLAELLHLLVDRGLLRRHGDGWRLTGELPQEMLPAGVQAVLAARIDALAQPSRALARDAAVLGSRFTLDMLRVLSPADRAEAAEAALADLVARGILLPLGDAGFSGQAYGFTHGLARDVVYAGIPKGDRARRHAAVAVWAATQPGPSGDIDALVAGQAEQAVGLATEMRLPAEDPAWAARRLGVEALSRLGSAALARDDNRRAEVLFTGALELAGPGDSGGAAASEDATDDATERESPVAGGMASARSSPALLLARIGRAAARVALHRLDDAEADLAEPLGSSRLASRSAALVVLGDIRRRRGDEPAAQQALVSALAAASEAGVDRVTGEALRQLGMIDFLAGRLGAAEERFGQSLALAERVGDRRGSGWALQHLAWNATTRGDYSLAERMLASAADVFGSLEDDGGLSWCAGTEAFVRLLQGRHTQARELARGLLPLGQARGDRWGTAACLTIDGFAAAELGQITVAVEQTTAAYEDFHALGDAWGQCMALVAAGTAWRGAGRLRRAVRRLESAVAVAESGHHPIPAALALGSIGYCRLDAGDAKAAGAAASRALEVMGAMDIRPGAMTGLRVLQAQAWRAQGRLDEAVELLSEARTVLTASLVFPRRQALAHLAGALLEQGNVADALVVTGEAFAEPAEDLRSRIVALRVLGGVLVAAGDRPAGVAALRLAMALAGATEMRSEAPASARALAAVTG